MDDILGILGIKGVEDYDDLTPDEQETYRAMLDIVQSGSISLEDFKKHVHSMRQSVEYELSSHERNDRKDLLLKARLKNYLLFEAFFEKPERARDMLKQYSSHSKTKL